MYFCCVAAGERESVLKNGFYRTLQTVFTETGFIPMRRHPVTICGEEYECYPYDCFQQPRKFYSSLSI